MLFQNCVSKETAIKLKEANFLPPEPAVGQFWLTNGGYIIGFNDNKIISGELTGTDFQFHAYQFHLVYKYLFEKPENHLKEDPDKILEGAIYIPNIHDILADLHKVSEQDWECNQYTNGVWHCNPKSKPELMFKGDTQAEAYAEAWLERQNVAYNPKD